MRFSMTAVLLTCVAVLPAAEWLMPGVHEVTTAREAITCTVVVPPAVSEGKPLPLVVVMAGDGKPDAKRWQEWGERHGAAVVGINGLMWGEVPGSIPTANSDDYATVTRKSYATALDAVRQKIPLHPFQRYLIAGQVAPTAAASTTVVPGSDVSAPTPGLVSNAQMLALLDDKEQLFGGLLIGSWIDEPAIQHLRKDVPVLFVVPGGGDFTNSITQKASERLAPLGGTVREAPMGKTSGIYMPFDFITSGMSMLFDLSSVTHERLTSIERRDNLEKVASQAQELAGIVNAGARRAYASFLMTIPGMDKRRRDYERLADVWLEASIVLAKEHEDLPEAHAFLCVVVRTDRFKAAGGKQQKAAQTELARMRKDPTIKKEQAAADILADTSAMLEHDASTAKQRIALKDLEAMVAQYPKTMAAKAATKLLDTLRQNLR
jgi:hypothetical protein